MLPLLKQYLGDQVSGNYIKHVDAEVGIVFPEKLWAMQSPRQMASDDQQNRNRPQAVERWNALHIRILP
jgi:hypothetical protein